jgi:hypothetical protein
MVDARSGGSLSMGADIDIIWLEAKASFTVPMGAPGAALKGSPPLTKGPLCSSCCAALPLLMGAPLQGEVGTASASGHPWRRRWA